ncbi:MAG: DUF4230 domain-containing protein [Alloprevotella sp.]|nr:DUF4230 domain-containing protein [Alloprevotella sp.]
MMRLLKTGLLLLPLFAACGKGGGRAGKAEAPIDTTRHLVAQLSRTARLYTTEYKIHKIVTYSDVSRLQGKILSIPVDIRLTGGDRKVAIPIDVTVRAYIDFGEFTDTNVERRADAVTVTLPDPHIVVTASRIDNKGVRQYIDLARTGFTDEEILNYARQGQDSIVSHIDRTEILRTAQRSAAQAVLPLLHRMGYAEDRTTVRFRQDLNPDNLRFELSD